MRRFAVIFIALAVLGGIPATAGAAVPTCYGRTPTLYGTGGDDILTGTPGDDVIVGRGGNDTIYGLAGNDIICGNRGDDVIHGGIGNDLIRGGTGNDEIHGGRGRDRIYGDSGDDVLDGDANRDRLRGDAGNDILRGGNHSDVLEGGDGTDTSRGGQGADECYGEEMLGCELIPLSQGDRGPGVTHLQKTLARKKLYRGDIDGVFDREVASSVATFHKVIGPAYTNPKTAVTKWQDNPPSEAITYDDWDDLLAFQPQEPKARSNQPDRVEVDIGRQVLYLMLDGEVDAIVHVSTGYDPGDTPRTTNLPNGGYFWYKHPYNGWSPKPGAWSIYKFWAYRAGREYNYGVHGYRSVPYWPASHGCTRVHVWEADYLHPRIFLNMPVHVWDL